MNKKNLYMMRKAITKLEEAYNELYFQIDLLEEDLEAKKNGNKPS